MMTNAQKWRDEQERNKTNKCQAMVVMDELIFTALSRHIIASPDSFLIQRAIQRGTPIPEHCLPGALIKRLSVEKREAIKSLRSEMMDGAVRWIKRYNSYVS